MKMRLLLSILLTCSLWSVGVMAGEEPVKGWYDPANDWFVMEWVMPSGRKESGIDDPPNKIVPVIKARTVYDGESKDYLYTYAVSNLGGTQLLQDIAVEYSSAIYNATAPSSDWYIMPNYRKQNEIRWAKIGGEYHGIPAGETAGLFSFRSKGVPGIINSAFWGRRRVDYRGPDYDVIDPDSEVANLYEKIINAFETQYPEKFKTIVLKTIGPTAPPKELKPLEFLDNIISMKHEAFKLGWITSDAIELALDQKLDAARKKQEQGNKKAASEILKAFINEVEAQGCESYEVKCPPGKHLKPEAYALLKYNAQYLVDNLK